MLQAFTSLHPTATEQLEQQQQQQAQQLQLQLHQQQVHQQHAAPAAATPASSAAQGLVKALDELPSEREMDAAAAPDAAAGADAGAASQQQQAQQALVVQPDQPVPQSLLAEQHRSGSAAQLDGSALQKVENIPPAHDMAIRAMVAAMQEPEELVRGQRGEGPLRGQLPACLLAR